MKINYVSIAKQLATNFHEVVKNTSKADLKKIILQCNEHYHNTDTPLISDDIYDQLKDYLETVLDKSDDIHTKVGADPRESSATNNTHRPKVLLPYWMGSMDKIKSNQKELDKWMKKNMEDNYIITDKLDGVSALYVCKEGKCNLYTRGNGLEGQDISDMLESINGLETVKQDNIVIRGELIIKKNAFENMQNSGIVKSTSNARNTVSGVVNAKLRNNDIIQCIDFVAYELIDLQGRTSLPLSTQLHLLSKELSFDYVATNVTRANTELSCESLCDYLQQRKNSGMYDIDGLILTTNVAQLRNESGNPKYAIAFKANISEKIVTVVGVEWNISKDGYLKPTVLFEPIEMGNVIIKKATGFNAKFIYEHKIGAGAKIIVTRSGDVIPFIKTVLQEASNGKPSMPMLDNIEYTWNSTKVDIYVPSKSNTMYQKKIFENMVDKLEFKGIGKGIIGKLFEGGIDDLKKLFDVKETKLLTIDGIKEKTARNILESIQDVKQGLSYEKLMVASNLLGRGVGPKSIKLVLKHIPDILIRNDIDQEVLNKINGFNDKTSTAFLENLPVFQKFLDEYDLHTYCDVISETNNKKHTVTVTSQIGNKYDGYVFVFSGKRDKQLMKYVLEQGGQLDKTMTSRVTHLVVDDLNENRGSKRSYAEKHEIQIVSTSSTIFN